MKRRSGITDDWIMSLFRHGLSVRDLAVMAYRHPEDWRAWLVTPEGKLAVGKVEDVLRRMRRERETVR